MVANEGHVVWSSWWPYEGQSSLFRLSTAFACVTSSTRRHEILPRGWALVLFRDHMIDGHLSITDAAVLAFIVVSTQHVALRQHHPPARCAHIHLKTYDTWHIKSRRYGSQQPRSCLYATGFAAKHKRKGSPNRADIEGLVVLIEDQHGTVQHRASPSRRRRDGIPISARRAHSWTKAPSIEGAPKVAREKSSSVAPMRSSCQCGRSLSGVLDQCLVIF